MASLADPAVQAKIAKMLEWSLDPPGGRPVEYGFIRNSRTSGIGKFFGSGQQRQIFQKDWRDDIGSPILGTVGNYPHFQFFHDHPNVGPGWDPNLSPGDRSAADAFGFVIIAITPSFVAHCYDGRRQ